MRRLPGIILALALAPGTLAASEPRRRLIPEVCQADDQPATTSFAIPQPVRASTRRADSLERSRRRHQARRSALTRLVLVAVAAAAASAIVLVEAR